MTAESRSMMVAAFELPIPKLMIVMPPPDAFGIELRSPRMGASKCSANSSTYFVKLVSKMWSEKSSSFLSV